MGQEAVRAEGERHGAGRRAENGVRAALIARRHDDEGARVAAGCIAMGLEQSSDVVRLHERNVARDCEYVVRRELAGRGRDRAGVPLAGSIT
jgi:hypothetical protein